jgi:hypothetical protein
MADTKISALSSASSLGGSEQIPGVQSGSNVKLTPDQIKTYVGLGSALAIANGGTGQGTKSAAFDALSPMTTKGDLIVGGTAGANARLAVGTDGYVLTADSTQANGLKWAADSDSGGGVNLATPNVWTGQQNFGTATLTPGATVNWNLNTQQVARLTLGGNYTIANPTNLVDGGTYILEIVQDGVGSRTVSWGANYKWLNSGGAAPTLSTTAGAVDIISFVSDGTYMYGVPATAAAGGGTVLYAGTTATLTVGFTVTPYSAGTKSSSTFTPDPALGNQQYITANGAFTLAPQSVASQIVIEVVNGASAGAITTSGYTKVTGDTYATTNANKYLFFSTKTQNYSHLNIVALQ